MEEAKSILASKTFWVALATVLAPIYPPAAALIAAQPDAAIAIAGFVFGALRFVTSKPVKLPGK